MRRFTAIIVLAALLPAMLVAGAVAAAAAPAWTVTPDAVASFSAGDHGAFAEGMAADRSGALWVSLTNWGLYDDTVEPVVAESNMGEVWRVRPGHAPVRVVKATDLTPSGMLLGVATDGDGHVYIAAYDMGSGETANGVYLVSKGKLTQIVELPVGAWPNGLAFRHGHLYITDSAQGAVWRARVGKGMSTPAQPWLQSDLLTGGDPSSDPSMHGIGANGIAFRHGRLFVSVSDYGRIVQVPVLDTGKPGKPIVVAEADELRTADGIAFDAFGGLWVTTNSGTTAASPSGALYRLTPLAGTWTIADDPGWLNYPTTPVFGTTASSHCTLYVENGAYFDFEDGSAPDVQALRVGIPGLTLW
jgi:sugar lactone lactonase YvrE